MDLVINASQWSTTMMHHSRHAMENADGSITLAYQGPGYDPYILRFDSTGVLEGPHLIGTNPLVGDSHGVASLCMDSHGRLHCFYGSHATEQLHAVSDGDLAQWTPAASPAMNATYPSCFKLANGELHLFMREQEAGWPERVWTRRISFDDGETWGSPLKIIEQSERRHAWYLAFAQTTGDQIAVGMTWHDLACKNTPAGVVGWQCRGNAYYFREVDGLWRNALGSPLSLPLIHPGNSPNSQCDVAYGDLPNEDHFNTPQPMVDASGLPHLLFVRGGGTSFDFVHAWFSGSSWQLETIASGDHLFDGGHLFERGGKLWAYLIRGGTPNSEGTASEVGRGGYLERWVKTAGAWSLDGMVDSSAVFNYPILIGDHVVYHEWGAEGASRLVRQDWDYAPADPIVSVQATDGRIISGAKSQWESLGLTVE
jgi:hypothetical protein